jgi:hypothetical protein
LSLRWESEKRSRQNEDFPVAWMPMKRRSSMREARWSTSKEGRFYQSFSFMGVGSTQLGTSEANPGKKQAQVSGDSRQDFTAQSAGNFGHPILCQ